MTSKFLDLIKRLTKEQPERLIPLRPRTTRPRIANQAQPDVKSDFATGISGSRSRYALGEPDRMTKLQQEGEWLAKDPTYGPGGSVIPKTSKLKAAFLAMLQQAGANANRALEQGNVGWGGVAQALGGAGGGAIGGAIDSNWVTRAKHDQAVAQNQEAQARQMEALSNEAHLEDLRTRAEARRREPKLEATKLEKEDAAKRDRDFAVAVSQILQQRETSTPEALQALIEETEERFSRRVPVVPFKGRDSSGSGAIRTITNSDGSQTIIRYKDGQWVPEFRGERSAADIAREDQAYHDTQTAAAQRTAKLNESSALYRKADNNELNAKQLEESLADIPLDTYEDQEERTRRKQEIDRLRGEARSLRVQGDKARSEGESIYVPKTRSAIIPKSDPLGLFTPDKHQFSKSAWVASNPGGNLSEAIRVARARGYKIVE